MSWRHKTLTAGLSLCLALVSTHAADKEQSTDPSKEAAAFLARFDWVNGPAKASIGGHAEIQVPAGYRFTGAKGAQAILKAAGNPTSGNELGYLLPDSRNWSVIFEFDDSGYVKDDEKDKLDAEAMLKSIRAGTEQSNKARKKMGASPITNVQWHQPPKYNEETHNLEWAIKGESDGETILNYNTRLLGRRGVMSVTLLVDPEKTIETLPAYQAMLKDYSFKEGERYAEYRQGDKLAKYGLAALIVGGAAAGAAKLGLFAWLVLFFKKAGKFIVLAVVAVAAFFRKLIFGGGRRNEQQQ
jgi:uncharacterized membrane-anchored protein